MFQLESAQMQTLGQKSQVRAVERILAYLKKHFPWQANFLGDTPCRALINHHIDQARTHGIRTERDVCLYIALTLYLGSGFLTDPQYRWAALTLKHSKGSLNKRLNTLFEQTIQFHVIIWGDHFEHLKRALHHVTTQVKPTHFEAPTVGTIRPVKERARRLFEELHPERYRATDASLRYELIDQRLEVLQAKQWTTDKSRLIDLTCVYLLGHHYDQDPQYPWVSHILGQQDKTPDAKADELYSQAKMFLTMIHAAFQTQAKG